MPLVMVDTNIAIRATLPIPGGVARKLWVIFAYGAASYRAEHLALDLGELAAEQVREGGVVRAHEAQIEKAEAEVARLEELLPVGTPSDWLLAGSAAAWDEYERIARERAANLKRKITPAIAEMLLRRYQSACVDAPKPAYVVAPQLTADPDDDLLVFDAMRVGADIFLSDDTDVVPDEADGSKEYEHGEDRVQAMRFQYFLDHYLDAIDWDQIDGAWI